MKLRPFAILIISGVFSLSLSGCANQGHSEQLGFTPGLGEIMSLTSMRHAKLWFAGQSKNWALAEYELEELQEGFEDAAKFHPTHKEIKQPIPQLVAKTMGGALAGLDKAIKAKNTELFTQHFDEVTAGCNACHQETDFGFNIVTRPSSNPFTNQSFSPN